MKQTRVFSGILLVFSLMVWAMPAAWCAEAEQAVEMRDGMPVFDLGQIEVVGQAEKTEPTAKTVLDDTYFDETLKESVVEVAQRAPGMYVTTGSKNEPQMVMRGFSQKRIAILYDGVPMAAPYYSDVDTSELPLDNLAEIKFVRGNASVMYGPNAMAGVVSLVSAKPGPEPNLTFTGSVDQEGNTVGRLSHGMKTGIFYYQLSAGFRDSDGFHLSDDFKTVYDNDGNVLEDGDVRDNASFNQWSAGIKTGIETDTSELSLSFNFQDAEKEIPATVVASDRPRFWNFPEWKKYSIMLAGRTEFSDSFDLRGNVFYHKYDNVLRSFSDITYSSVRWESTYDDYSTGALLRAGWTVFEPLTLRMAANTLMDNHKEQGDVGDPWAEYKANTYSLSTEAEWSATDSLTVQLGVGYEIYNFDSVTNLEGNSKAIADRAKDVDAPGFSVLGTYMIGDAHELTAGISLKNRFPNMHEMFSNIEEFAPEDVTTLDAETSMQYSVGYTYQVTEFAVGVSGFYYDVDDMIERPDRDGLYENIDSAQFKGFELWGDYGMSTGFTAGFSYSYTNATDESPGMDSRDLPYVPEHTLNLDLGYRFAFGTSITAAMSYRSDVTEYPGADAVEVPSYSLYDLTVRHDFDFGLGVTLQGLNLADKNYYQETGYPQPGRTFKLGIHYKL